MTRQDCLQAVANVETAAFTAAVPAYVVDTYRADRDNADQVQRDAPAGGGPGSPNDITEHVARQARSSCSPRVLWHPWLTVPYRRLRARNIRRVLTCGLTGPAAAQLNPEHGHWRVEHKILQMAKRKAKKVPREIAGN